MVTLRIMAAANYPRTLQAVAPMVQEQSAQDYLVNPFSVKQPVEPTPIPPAAPPFRKLYQIFDKYEDIEYVPENALKNGLNMVATLKDSLKKLELGSKLRKDVWMREIEEYARRLASRGLVTHYRPQTRGARCSDYHGSCLWL